MVNTTVVGPRIVAVKEQTLLYCRNQKLVCDPSDLMWVVLTSLEARHGRRDLDAPTQQVWQAGEGDEEDESQQGCTSIDASFASQCHVRGHGISGRVDFGLKRSRSGSSSGASAGHEATWRIAEVRRGAVPGGMR